MDLRTSSKEKAKNKRSTFGKEKGGRSVGKQVKRGGNAYSTRKRIQKR